MKEKIIGLVITIIGITGGISSWTALNDPLKTILLIVSIIALVIGLAIIISRRFFLIPFVQRPYISLEQEIKRSNEVWFSWYSGSVKLAEGSLFENNHKYKFILTKPNSMAIHEIGKVANIGEEELNSDIIKFTNIIKSKKHEIKWFDGFIGSSMIISDPEKSIGWVRIEAFLPYIGSKFRPSIKIYKKYNETAFLRYKNLFLDLWEKGVDPT